MENAQMDSAPKSGGETSPLLLIAVGVVPLLALALWLLRR